MHSILCRLMIELVCHGPSAASVGFQFFSPIFNWLGFILFYHLLRVKFFSFLMNSNNNNNVLFFSNVRVESCLC